MFNKRLGRTGIFFVLELSIKAPLFLHQVLLFHTDTKPSSSTLDTSRFFAISKNAFIVSHRHLPPSGSSRY